MPIYHEKEKKHPKMAQKAKMSSSGHGKKHGPVADSEKIGHKNKTK